MVPVKLSHNIRQCPAVLTATPHRHGTLVVSGVGHRGAFIGSITVKLSDVKLSFNTPCPVFAVTRCRYGTHFVSGVGHRGAFIGSITVKLSDVKLAAGASVSFKASYKNVSTMAELKTSMEQSLQTSDVTVSDLVTYLHMQGSCCWCMQLSGDVLLQLPV
jgi:hypothetical protein